MVLTWRPVEWCCPSFSASRRMRGGPWFYPHTIWRTWRSWAKEWGWWWMGGWWRLGLQETLLAGGARNKTQLGTSSIFSAMITRIVTYAKNPRMRRFLLSLDAIDILCLVYSNFCVEKKLKSVKVFLLNGI